MTVGEYLDSWLKGSVQGSVRQSTVDRYESAIRLHINPALGRLKLKKLTPARIQGFYRDRLDAGLAPASVGELHVILHKALSPTVKWNMVEERQPSRNRNSHRGQGPPRRQSRV